MGISKSIQTGQGSWGNGNIWVIIYHNHSAFVSCAPLSVLVYSFVNVRSLFVLYCHKNPPIAEIQKSQLEMYSVLFTSQINAHPDTVANTVTSLAISNLCSLTTQV
jgi:hypothetical protein